MSLLDQYAPDSQPSPVAPPSSIVNSMAPQQVQGNAAVIPVPSSGSLLDRYAPPSPSAPQVQGVAASPADVDPSTDGSSPASAINISPVETADRMKLALGNAKGGMNYLKNKFDDVSYDKDKGVVVKKDGVWHQVDPSGWGGGNAWDKTKEVANTLAEKAAPLAANIFAVGEGAAEGTAMGSVAGPAGAVAGGIAGAAAGGAGAEGVRTSLGRLYGTYDATPEEQLRDVGAEALINAGGQTLALGVKPTIGMVARGVSNVAEYASPAAKNAMEGVLTHLTGIKPQNAAQLMNDAPGVMKEVAAVSPGATSGEMQDKLVSRATDNVHDLFSNAQKALSSQFQSREDALLSSVPSNFKADIGSTVKDAMGKLNDAGFVNYNSNTGKYFMNDPQEVAKLLSGPYAPPIFAAQAAKHLGAFVSHANSLMDTSVQEGGDAIKSLLDTRRGFDKLYFAAAKSSDDAASLLRPISSDLRANLVGNISAAGPDVANQYKAMNDFYSSKMIPVAQAERLADSKSLEATGRYLSKLSGDPGSHMEAKQLLDEVSSLKGPQGQALAQQIRNQTAARDFVNMMPSIGANPSTAAKGFVGYEAASHLGPLAAVVGAPIAAASSPRLMGKAVSGAQQILPYAQKFGDLMKSLPPAQMRQLIMDPGKLPALVNSTYGSYLNESKASDQLLHAAGVTNPAPQPQLPQGESDEQ